MLITRILIFLCYFQFKIENFFYLFFIKMSLLTFCMWPLKTQDRPWPHSLSLFGIFHHHTHRTRHTLHCTTMPFSSVPARLTLLTLFSATTFYFFYKSRRLRNLKLLTLNSSSPNPKLNYVLLHKKVFSISLIKCVWYNELGISTIIWKLTIDVAVLTRAWATSLRCLIIHLKVKWLW
jgi:hypothetical protein